eukprot:NODE_5147_length_713_cov_38.460843_g4780_i0.p1 GENE.NODE_5147_length_713_cov_38.460843_g4780_i0~~NODE_5147_length_713_cov_38.460843_g4780_i0.p1  ORF type:complete len:160 (+),score=32.27 NODE_5147_length_713_cov_38.460843_g4780_i0:108-587(+)
MASFYDIPVKTAEGAEIKMDQWKGQVALVVNVASRCGFTDQYTDLQKIHDTYKDRGFSVIGVPCNQFGGQEPGTESEILCFVKDKYKADFPMLSKVEVNGSNEAPLFKFLKNALPGIMGTTSIKWNFTKFLVDRNGKPVKRYSPNDKPLSIAKDIEALL